MSSLSRQLQKSGIWSYRLWVRPQKNGRRSSVWLGDLDADQAKEISDHISRLEKANATGTQASPVTLFWLSQIDDGLHGKLSAIGLAEPRVPRIVPGKLSLQEFCDHYVKSRKNISDSTCEKYEATVKMLVRFFGAKKLIGKINAGDADDWQQNLFDLKQVSGLNEGKRKYADATISKCTKHVRMFFDYGVRKMLVESNPFQHLKSTGEENRDRQHFVSRDVIDPVMAKASDAQWRLIIGLSRYGALRCPSEVLDLKWEDIDMETGKMRITSQKTKRHKSGVRVCPIFPELVQYCSAR